MDVYRHETDSGCVVLIRSPQQQPAHRGRIPMKRVWRGRVRDRVWKAFIALDGQMVSTGELVRRTWPRRQGPFNSAEYARVRAAAAEVADVVGHDHRGRNSRVPGGLIWRAR
jgi:hypothetical protein